LGQVNGAIIGSRWVSGRWVGKMALAFKSSSDRVRFRSYQAAESMTIAMWVRVDQIDAEPGARHSLLHSDGQDPGDLQIHLDHRGKLHMELIGRDIELTSRWRADPALLGRWVHLVWVLDGRNKQVRSYVNGRLDSRQTNVSFGTVGLNGPAQLGNWDQQHRNLQGLVDELLIAGRPMSRQEIADLYEAGNPY
ncbi:MAG: LamG domain-containing protein, partial [Phycisphaeraceae bacterium]|nr:LamG domain-containing protein [Phycisphaeraceae bacterium]